MRVDNFRIWRQTHPQNGMIIINMVADIDGRRFGVSSTVSPEMIENKVDVILDAMKKELMSIAMNVAEPTRRLRAVWTMDAQQDLRAMHNLNAELELTEILAAEIMDAMPEFTTRRQRAERDGRVFTLGRFGSAVEVTKLAINWKKEGF